MSEVLAFVAIRVVLNTAHRMVYPYLPVFSRGLGVDLALLRLAVSARSAVGILGPFLASVADSRGRRAGMLFGLGMFSLGALLVFAWPGYLTFILALILTLLGKYIFDPSLHAYIGDRVPYERRGFIVALTELGWSLSFIAGIPAVGLLIARWGWQAPFPVLALLGAAAAVLIWRSLPHDPPDGTHTLGLQHNLGMVLKSLPALLGLSIGFLISSSNEVINVVFGVWLEDSFGLKIAALGAASAVIGLSELGGEGLTAGISDRLGKPRAVALGLIFNSLAALLLPLIGRSLPGALLGLFLFYISFEFTIVSSIPMMTEILPQARATFMAVFVASHSAGRALGALLSLPLYSTGILGSCLAAVGFNLLALYAVLRLSRDLGSRV